MFADILMFIVANFNKIVTLEISKFMNFNFCVFKSLSVCLYGLIQKIQCIQTQRMKNVINHVLTRTVVCEVS